MLNQLFPSMFKRLFALQTLKNGKGVKGNKITHLQLDGKELAWNISPLRVVLT